jgi:clan AA aspartic protease (TIGR02281 family)
VIDADPSGHFTGLFAINGRKEKGMVDTGASMVAINVSTAQRIGISRTELDFRYAVDTANGQARGRLCEASTGSRSARSASQNVGAMVLEDKALSGNTLIGMSFLKGNCRPTRYRRRRAAAGHADARSRMGANAHLASCPARCRSRPTSRSAPHVPRPSLGSRVHNGRSRSPFSTFAPSGRIAGRNTDAKDRSHRPAGFLRPPPSSTTARPTIARGAGRRA